MKIDLKDPGNWIPKEIFLDYCGQKSEKMGQFYEKALAKKQPLTMSLNWLGILLLPAWFGYRKQWQLFWIFTVIFAAIPVLEYAFQFSIPNSAFLGAVIVMGLMANGLLLNDATLKYHKLKKSGLDDRDISQELKDKASPSVPLAIGAALLHFAIVFLVVYLLDLYFASPY